MSQISGDSRTVNLANPPVVTLVDIKEIVPESCLSL